MGKLVKKFEQYVKEDLLPQRDQTSPDVDFDYDDDIVDTSGSDAQGEESEEELTRPKYTPKQQNFEEDFESSNEEEQEEEDPGYEGGRMLLELAKKLNAKVVNNEINYNGSTITCYSEDNKFRIGDQIIGSNVQEAYKNLQAGKFDSDESEEFGGEDEFVPESFKFRKKRCNCCENCNTNKCNCRNCKS